MKKQITKDEYMQLQGIFHLGSEYSKKWQECEKALHSLLEIDDSMGSLFGDAMVSIDRTVDEIMKIEGIKVTKNNV